jgi:protein-S-isoprenylcysteine O-methyltransferase Ste14
LAAAGAKRIKSFRRTKLYDLLAASPLIVWFAFWGVQMLPTLGNEIALAKVFVQTDPSVLPATLALRIVSKIVILVFFSLLIVLFTIRYIPTAGASGFYPRLTAVAGTFISVGIAQLAPREISIALYVASLLLMIGGFAFAVWAVLCLGRSISILPEARQLVTHGPYAFVRHPLYLGEMVGTAGIALQFSAPWALILLGLQYIFQILRMINEERLLLQIFPQYKAYLARTARLVPGVY